MIFLGPGGTPRAGHVLTTLTTRDGVPHARPEGAPCAGAGSREWQDRWVFLRSES
jgi:hypothetical protein